MSAQLLILLICYAVCTPLPVVGACIEPGLGGEQSAILQKIRTCNETTNYRGVVRIVWYRDKGPIERINAVTFAAPDMAWIERMNAPQAGSVICRRNGRYYERKAGNQSFVLKESEFGRDFLSPGYAGIDLIQENYNVQVEKTLKIFGRTTLVLRIEADAERRPWYRLSVDEDTGLILIMEKYEGDRKLYFYEFTELELNPKISKNLFNILVNDEESNRSYRFFSSVKEMEQTLGYPLIRPKFLPSGYLRQKARIIERDGNKIAHLVFSNGASTLSYFQRCVSPVETDLKIAVGELQTSDRRGMVVVSYRSESFLFTIIGDLDQEQMKLLMETLAHSSALSGEAEKKQ